VPTNSVAKMTRPRASKPRQRGKKRTNEEALAKRPDTGVPFLRVEPPAAAGSPSSQWRRCAPDGAKSYSRHETGVKIQALHGA